jgi:hypothetical protein
MTHLDVLPTASASFLAGGKKADHQQNCYEESEEEGGATSCTLTHFREYAVVVRLLESFVSSSSGSSAGIDKICMILEYYQEQPFLLDSYLEQMVSAATTVIAVEGDAWLNSISAASSRSVINERLEKSFQLLYVLSKVRGYKTIGNTLTII